MKLFHLGLVAEQYVEISHSGMVWKLFFFFLSEALVLTSSTGLQDYNAKLRKMKFREDNLVKHKQTYFGIFSHGRHTLLCSQMD